MQELYFDIHLIILLLIMLVSGAFGGFLNYLNNFDTTAKENGSKKVKYNFILLGIGAAFLVPLFLKMISSNIISGTDNLDYLIFAGFCLIAAIFSRRFISSIGDRILEAANRAEKVAMESKRESEIMQRQLLSTKERVEDVKLAVDIQHMDDNTLKALHERPQASLWALADSYEKKTSVPDYYQRLSLKAEMGRKMGEIIIRNRLSKEELLSGQQAEGLSLAIAYAVQLRPEAGDWAVLQQLSGKAGQLFTRHAILIAFDTLARNSLIPKDQLEETLKTVRNFKQNADPALLEKIRETENILAMDLGGE